MEIAQRTIKFRVATLLSVISGIIIMTVNLNNTRNEIKNNNFGINKIIEEVQKVQNKSEKNLSLILENQKNIIINNQTCSMESVKNINQDNRLDKLESKVFLDKI